MQASSIPLKPMERLVLMPERIMAYQPTNNSLASIIIQQITQIPISNSSLTNKSLINMVPTSSFNKIITSFNNIIKELTKNILEEFIMFERGNEFGR